MVFVGNGDALFSREKMVGYSEMEKTRYLFALYLIDKRISSAYTLLYRSKAQLHSTIIVRKDMWQVALKAPSGVKYQEWDQETSQWQKGSDINDWFQKQLASGDAPWTSWILFNDEPPSDDPKEVGADPEGSAHAKGAVCWNDTQLIYLLHSVPKFPMRDEAHANTFVPKRIPDAETIYGQSFCSLLLPIEQLDVLFTHLHLDDPLVYERNDPAHKWGKRTRLPAGSDLITHVEEFYKCPDDSDACAVTIDLISKSAKWNQCLFADYISSHYGPLLCETWGRSWRSNTDTAIAAQEVTWKDGTSYHSSQDHSKWACSSEENGAWCGVFDGNFMTSQKKRGFGGVIIHCKPLADSFKKMVTSTLRTSTPIKSK